FAQQLDGGELRGERRAEFVADVGQHRVARAAHALELGFVAQHLDLQPVHDARARDDGLARARARLQLFDGLRAETLAGPQDRAGRGGAGTRAARRAWRGAGLEHVAAELADGILRIDTEQPRRLRVEVADVAFLVDGVHALDHGFEDHLRLGLAMPQLRVEVDQIAPHVVHRAGELADLGRTRRRDRGREV